MGNKSFFFRGLAKRKNEKMPPFLHDFYLLMNHPVIFLFRQI